MIAIVVSDKRMERLAQIISQTRVCLTIKKPIDLIDAIKQTEYLEAIVLPMGGLNDNNEVKIESQMIRLTELLQRLKPDTLIFTGRMSNLLQSYNKKIINLSEVEELKYCHAKLSAHGVLSFLIEKTPRDFTEYSYDVLGYGACGEEITRCLINNGCQVRVVSRRNHEIEGSINYYEYASNNPSDIVIISASGCVFTKELIKNWKFMPRYVLDLSSHSVGIEKGIDELMSVYSLSALPAISGMDTSSKLICQIIEKELKK